MSYVGKAKSVSIPDDVFYIADGAFFPDFSQGKTFEKGGPGACAYVCGNPCNGDMDLMGNGK